MARILWKSRVARTAILRTDNHGQPIAGMEFSGGQIFDGPWGRVASANLTPDPSGISYYDEALFVQTMRTGYVKARPLNQFMPWHILPEYDG